MSYVPDGGTAVADVTVTVVTLGIRTVPDFGINYEDISVTGTAYFNIVGLNKPDRVTINKQFTITVTVVNNGGESGDVTVRLYENGNLVATQTITIAPGGTGEVQFTRQAPSTSGTLTYKIELYNNVTNAVDDQASFTINVTAPSTGGVSGTAIVGLIILLMVLLLLFARRK